MSRNRRYCAVVAVIATAVLITLSGPVFADPPHPPLYKGERLVKLATAYGPPTHLSGWTRDGRGKVYALHVVAGQKINIRFSTPSQYTYLVIFDLANTDEEAIYSSDEDGKDKTLTVASNSTWLIRPYYSRMSPRQGLGAPYEIVIGAR